MLTASHIMNATLLVICAFMMMIIINESDANKARHAVEQTQFVCLDDDDRIVTGPADDFHECVNVVFRHADEDNVH